MFFSPPIDFNPTRAEVASFGGYQAVKYHGVSGNQFDITRRPVSVLRFGQAEYHLRHPTYGTFLPPCGGNEGEFYVESFGGNVAGRGRNPKEGYEDWLKRFHVLFQELYAKRPFEMEGTEKQLWDRIESQVDVDRYRANQPAILHQRGRIVRARPYPEMIEWEDGTREWVHLERMPSEFAAYKAAQRFEAVVHRHPVTYKLLKVEYVKRLPSRKKRSPEESKRLWESIPGSETLPDSTWD